MNKIEVIEEVEQEEPSRNNTTILWTSAEEPIERYMDESAQLLEKATPTAMEIGKEHSTF